MLLTFPVEIQSHILAHLPRRDLSSVVRGSQHLHAVAVRILYAHVELHSFDQVEAFFHLGPTPIASKHLEPKRIQWDRVKMLAITIALADSQRTLGTLPSSLAGPGVGPLRLHRLRVTYHDDAECLLPLLRCLDPAELGLCRTSRLLDPRTDRWLSCIPAWSHVAHVTLGCPPSPSSLTAVYRHQGGSGPGSPFPQATFARLLLPRVPYGMDFALWYLAEAIVYLCPNVDGVEVCVSDKESTSIVEALVERGTTGQRHLGGKPASYYSVVAKLEGPNIWGDVEEGDA